jgi:hypothetical protein
MELGITAEFEWDNNIHGRAEPFMILVEDCD